MSGKKRVLFVCVHNSCRSQMAEGLARHLAGAEVEAFSAGSAPCGEVDPGAIAAMCEINVDISAHRSKSLAEIPNVSYDFVATMGCGDACPWVQAKEREDWHIPDPKGKSHEAYQTARDEITRRVRALLERLHEE